MCRREYWLAAMAISIACSSSTPPPEPQRSPSPTLPSCLTDADCSAGEECRDGVCSRHGVDGGGDDDDDGCPQGCDPSQICADGVCVGRIVEGDAGPEELPCGGCPEGQECDEETEMCRPRARADAGSSWEQR